MIPYARSKGLRKYLTFAEDFKRGFDITVSERISADYNVGEKVLVGNRVFPALTGNKAVGHKCFNRLFWLQSLIVRLCKLGKSVVTGNFTIG